MRFRHLLAAICLLAALFRPTIGLAQDDGRLTIEIIGAEPDKVLARIYESMRKHQTETAGQSIRKKITASSQTALLGALVRERVVVADMGPIASLLCELNGVPPKSCVS